MIIIVMIIMITIILVRHLAFTYQVLSSLIFEAPGTYGLHFKWLANLKSDSHLSKKTALFALLKAS